MEDTIQADSPIPRYFQLKNALLEDFSAHYSPGDKLPTELHICKSFSVSRATVRKTMDLLVQEGFISRTAGRGSFLLKDVASPARLPEKKKTPTIIMLGPLFKLEGVMPACVAVLEYRATTLGYHFTLLNLTHSVETVKRQLESVIGGQEGSGVILFPIPETSEDAHRNKSVMKFLDDSRTPFVIVDHLPLETPELKPQSTPRLATDLVSYNHSFIIPDNYMGGMIATNHLLRLGHRRIAYLGDCLLHSSYLRQRGFEDAARNSPDACEAKVYRHDNLIRLDLIEGYVGEILDSGITAIFSENDLIAREVLRELTRRRVAVPAEVSLIGYDNMDFCSDLSVPLTTIRQPIRYQMELAAEVLFDMILRDRLTLRQMMISVELIERSSTAPLAASLSAPH